MLNFPDPRTGGESARNHENGRKPSQEKQNVSEQRRERKPDSVKDSLKDNRSQHLKKREDIMKPNRPLNTNAGQARHTNLNAEQKVNKESKLQPRRLEKTSAQRRMVGNQKDVRMRLKVLKSVAYKKHCLMSLLFPCLLGRQVFRRRCSPNET